MDPTTRTAVIGLGGMGSGMARRLVETGWPVTVYNRTPSRASAIVDAGATLADTPAAAAASADVVIICVSDESVVDRLLDGPDGILAACRPGTVVADATTTSSGFARQLASRAAAARLRPLDLGLLGSPFHARTGESRILVGGTRADFETARPVLEALSSDLRLLGPAGAASAMKIALNMTMGAQMAMLAEAATLAECHGIDRDDVLAVLGSGGYCSPMVAFRCSVVRNGSFQPAAFKTSLMAKDMRLAVSEAEQVEMSAPLSSEIVRRLEQASDQGIADLDVSALVPLTEWDAGLATWPDDLELPTGSAGLTC